MRVAALGRTRMLFDSIRHVADAGHDIVLIGTCKASPEYGVTEHDFAALAQDIGCTYFCDHRLSNDATRHLIAECQADIAISVNWLTIIREEVLQLFPRGILNAHAGDLPRYRGNAAPNWAILNGEPAVCLTIHEMVEQLDAGPIVLQERLPLTSDTYIGDVYEWLDQQVPLLMSRSLQGLEDGTISPRQQSTDPSEALRCLPRRLEDSAIDWSQSAEQIHRLVRASSEPLSGAFTWWNQQRLKVWRTHIEQLAIPHQGVPGQVVWVCRESGHVGVLAGDSALVVLEEVSIGEQTRIRPAEEIRSARDRLGLNVEEVIKALQQRIVTLESWQAERNI